MEAPGYRLEYPSRLGRTITLGRATPVRFSAYRCFETDDAPATQCLEILARYLLTETSAPAFRGCEAFARRLLDCAPPLRDHVRCSLTDDIDCVFLTETHSVKRQLLRQQLPAGLRVIDADVLAGVDWQVIPERAWIPAAQTIYPIELPEIHVAEGLDLLLLDCPARNMGLAPNGLAYVHSALAAAGVNFQTLDLDIICYHRFHMHRLLDDPEAVVPAEDPWLAENGPLWKDSATLEHFGTDLDEAVEAIVAARPKILAVSVHESNALSTRHVVARVKSRLPETVILAGGYSCGDPHVGLRAFDLADYMAIGEADLTVGPLVKAILAGGRPADAPGVLSRYDLPGRVFQPGNIPHDLGRLDMPRYPWASIRLYRNHNGYQLVPVVGSRGCRWSRCNFCTERFLWRGRTPGDFVDEIEWLTRQDCDLFMFNDSDLNGDPDFVMGACDEIVRRGLTVRLTGQMRIDRRNTREFFDRMRGAGFVALRFGVDAWCADTLKISRKGYSVEVIAKVLEDCTAAGIFTEVNIVVGYPGETEANIDETIANILAARRHIGRMAVINPLMLKAGSEFWLQAEEFKIHFRRDKEQLYLEYPQGIPAEFWYSEGPYIDEDVRAGRVYRLSSTLAEHGMVIGEVATSRIRQMRDGKEQMRGRGRPEASPAIGSDEPPGAGAEVAATEDAFVFPVGEVFVRAPRIAKAKIERLIRKGRLRAVREIPGTSIEQIAEGFHGYNLVKVGLDYYGLRQGRQIDFERIESGTYRRDVCVRGKSLSAVREAVARIAGVSND